MFPAYKQQSPKGLIDVCKVPAPPAPFAPVPFPNFPSYKALNEQADALAKQIEKDNKRLTEIRKQITGIEDNLRAQARVIQAHEAAAARAPRPSAPRPSAPSIPAPPRPPRPF